MGKWAESWGKGEEFHLAVFKAYFAEGLNIARISVLVQLAESIGLMGAEEVLSKEACKGAVNDDWRYSRACGIIAVPIFVANGRRVVGAQPHNMLEQLINEQIKRS